MEVFLTGSTGLLGLNLVHELVDAGHSIRALARDKAKAARLLPQSPKVQVVVGDLDATEKWTESIIGCDAVINAGAYFREIFGPGEHEGALQRINVDGAVALYHATTRASVSRFIQVSSDGVLAPRADGKLSREEDAPGGRMTVNPYIASKWRAEEALRSAASGNGPTLIIVRPGWMFGPHDNAPTTAGEMVAKIVAGEGVQLVDGAPMGVADVRDVAHGVRLCLEASDPPAITNLTGNAMTALSALKEIASAAGRGSVQKIPFPLAMALSRFLSVPTSLLRIANPIPPAGLLTLRNGVTGDNSRARALGATFRPFTETARDAVAWIAKNSEFTDSA